MTTGQPIPDAIRTEAVADYRTSGESLVIVARRHGVSKAALAAWVNPNHVKRTRGYAWTEDEIAYIGGWEVRGGVRYPLFPEQRSA